MGLSALRVHCFSTRDLDVCIMSALFLSAVPRYCSLPSVWTTTKCWSLTLLAAKTTQSLNRAGMFADFPAYLAELPPGASLLPLPPGWQRDPPESTC